MLRRAAFHLQERSDAIQGRNKIAQPSLATGLRVSNDDVLLKPPINYG